MGIAIFGWVLAGVILAFIAFLVFQDKIQSKWQARKTARILKREVPPEDRFDDQLRKYLERHRYGER